MSVQRQGRTLTPMAPPMQWQCTLCRLYSRKLDDGGQLTVCHAWLRFEREEGTPDDYAQASVTWIRFNWVLQLAGRQAISARTKCGMRVHIQPKGGSTQNRRFAFPTHLCVPYCFWFAVQYWTTGYWTMGMCRFLFTLCVCVSMTHACKEVATSPYAEESSLCLSHT